MSTASECVANAWRAGLVVPAFNIPYLPMMRPVIRAVIDQDCFAFIETARLEWAKFGSQGPAAVAQEFRRWEQPDYVTLHLDHIPVIDEDGQEVDYLPIIHGAIGLGYQSVMIDGSRLELEANIEATREVVSIAHRADIPCEAELGAVLGHEAGPLPPYQELFESGQGFTDVAEAKRFVQETRCDWLSVAIGNVHGAVSGALRDKEKVEARLNLDHLEKLSEVTGVPLVLHGGSGVRQEYLRGAIRRGVAKVNIGTEIRQAYESAYDASCAPTTEQRIAMAQEAVYGRTSWMLCDYFGLTGTRELVTA